MTPEELENLKRLVDEENAKPAKPFECHAFETPVKSRREPGLVRAELVDALRDYSEIFREKAAMEQRRAEAVDIVASKVEAGGSAEQPDLEQSKEFEREQYLLHMRFQEVQLRCNRLILEHGNN